MMNVFRRMLIVLAALSAMCINVYAQDNLDVTLTVLGTGTTKEEAVTNALRSAIEQAYGVFVSSDLTILNDDVVKNEIATISKGNVKSYKELSVSRLPNNEVAVSLSAVVSTSKLVSYAKSKGAAVEFSGAVFGQRLKIMELNEKNERIALENMKHQLQQIIPHLFYVELEVGSPVILSESASSRWYKTLDGGFSSHYNRSSKMAYFNSLRKQMNCIEAEPRYYSEKDADMLKISQAKYVLPGKIKFYANSYNAEYKNVLLTTIESLSLSETEVAEYRKLNKSVFFVGMRFPGRDNKYGCEVVTYPNDKIKQFYFRTDAILRTFDIAGVSSSLFDFNIIAKMQNNDEVGVPYSFPSVLPVVSVYRANNNVNGALIDFFTNQGTDDLKSYEIGIWSEPGKLLCFSDIELYIGGLDLPVEQITSFEIKQDDSHRTISSSTKNTKDKKKKQKISFAERLTNAVSAGVKVMTF